MKKYVASRKDVCAGQLLRIEHPNVQILGLDAINLVPIDLETTGIRVSVTSALVCRGMLFNVNEFGLANDLVYTTPVTYPIKGISEDKESNFIIEHYVELNEILKYLEYGEDLTQRDLNKIHKTLIANNKWLRRNSDLFGLKKVDGGYSLEDDGILPLESYEKLDWISHIKASKPSPVESGYQYIKKKSIF